MKRQMAQSTGSENGQDDREYFSEPLHASSCRSCPSVGDRQRWDGRWLGKDSREPLGEAAVGELGAKARGPGAAERLAGLRLVEQPDDGARQIIGACRVDD